MAPARSWRADLKRLKAGLDRVQAIGVSIATLADTVKTGIDSFAEKLPTSEIDETDAPGEAGEEEQP